MAQSIQAVGEQMLYPADNASFAESTKLDAPTATALSMLQHPMIAIGFALLLIVLAGRAFGGKKLPAGTKPLPILPGTRSLELKVISHR